MGDEGGENEDEDDLVVLPPAVKAEDAAAKSQLQRLMSNAAGGGISISRHDSLRRQLKRGASHLKVEDARSSGRYVESQETSTFGMLVGNGDVAAEEGGGGAKEEEEEEEKEEWPAHSRVCGPREEEVG